MWRARAGRILRDHEIVGDEVGGRMMAGGAQASAAGHPPRAGGWGVVASYAAVAGASQLLWLTYAPVTTAAAHHYGVSVSAIGWLANVFPLLYVVLAVPAGLALDHWPRPDR